MPSINAIGFVVFAAAVAAVIVGIALHPDSGKSERRLLEEQLLRLQIEQLGEEPVR